MNPDDVVISGIGGNFPKASNVLQFKEKLYSNEILLGSRWKEGERGVSNKLGIVDSPDKFDTAFFGIHRNQCTYMDPMQRMTLERTFEALVDAGVNPQDVRGRKIGVFASSSVGENDNLFYESIVSGFGVTGHSRAMMANRISYWLDLKGPSAAYDSNWVGGIEVLRLAADAIRKGRCESAIIGSVNLALNSEISWLYNDMGLLSADGSTKAFDKDASGYARADGTVVMFLQKARDANRAYATVVHSATIYNGNRDGPILDLDLKGMTEFIAKFYDDCDVDPREVEYVEAYGCGIKKTDETELKAIESVYCKNRDKPLLIGAMKPQTGHPEACDNLMAIAKVLIAFETQQIPATLQYENPNPNIPGLFNGNLEIVTKNRPWKAQYAAVHGIGITSSYAHVLLKSNPKGKRIVEDDMPKLVVASTRTESGIQEILKTLQSDPTIDSEYIALTHKLFSKNISGHLYRGYTVLDKSDMPKQEFEHFPGNKRPIWFIYSGMGSQWPGMATELLKLPIFAESIMKSHKILLSKGIDLLNIITTTDPKIFDSILHSFVGIAAIQIALTDVLRALGIEPDGIIGHSVGELGCAYADGGLTAEQMILCSYSRGKASIEVELIRGMMAAIGLGYNEVKDQLPPSIEVACHNAKDNCTLSGPTEDMEVYVKQLQDKGLFARLVNVSNIAYHSRYIKPAAPKLLEYLREIIPHPKARSEKWISTSAPKDKWNTEEAKLCSAEYHTNNLLGSVLFEEGSKYIPEDAIAIEIAPHGLLQAILKRSLKSGTTNIPMTQRGNKNALQFLLTSIGKMYLAGIDVNVAAIYPPIEFPVSRGTTTLGPLVHWEHSEKWRIGIEDKMNYLVSIKDLHIMLNLEEFRYLSDHELGDNCVFPLSSFLDIALEIISCGLETPPTDVVFENIQCKNMLIIPKIGSISLHAMVQKGSGNFEILSGETVLLYGRIYIPEASERNVDLGFEMGKTVELSGQDVYSEFAHRGHKYSAEFKSIKSLTIGKEGQFSRVAWQNNWRMLLEALLQQSLFKEGEKYQNVLTPLFIQKIVLNLANLPTTNEDVEVSYDYYTNTISCDSMQVIGLTNKNVAENVKSINLHNIDFVPFVNYAPENMEIILHSSLQIALSNFEEPNIKNITVTEIESSNVSFADNINKVLGQNIDINCYYNQSKENKVAIISSRSPLLIIYNDVPTANILNLISSSHAFGLVRTGKNILSSESQVIEVANFLFENGSYSLIKKLPKALPHVVQAKSDMISAKDLTKEDLPWVRELKSAASGGKTILLTCSVVPVEGTTNFVSALRSTLGFKSVRCLFVLDKNVDVNQNSVLMKSILRRDLYLSVLKNSSCGTYIPIPIDFLQNLERQLPTDSALISKKQLQYIGINVDDETLTNEKHDIGLGNIDYSGVNSNGEGICGLARLDIDTCDLVADPILHWKIPDHWSLEDACTVPHAYVTAYNILVGKCRVLPGETVLVHNGCSAIGLASIAIAQTYGCTTFVTVATDEQKLFIKKYFPRIIKRNILTNQNSSFETDLLLATGGQGAHVIINTLSKSLLSSGVRCLAEQGRFIQLGKFDVKEHYSIGMSVFLRNTSVGTAVPEEIFNLHDDDKEAIRVLVQQGIDKRHIRLIPRKVRTEANLKSILNELVAKENIGKILIKVQPDLGVNSLNLEKPNQYICDPRSSYVIYGGVAERWTDLVEWLVFRGARKIIVISDSQGEQRHLNRRLDLLRNYYKAQIQHIPNKIQTKENANEFLSAVCKTGPINAIFVLPTKTAQLKDEDVKPIQYIDMVSRNITPKTLFVNFCSGAFGIGEVRGETTFPTYNIDWPSTVEFSDVLHDLDEVLKLKTKHVVVKGGKTADLLQETPEVLHKKLILMLPASSEDLLEEYRSAPAKARFEQVLTLGPRRIREVPPMFVIPGFYNRNTVSDMCFEFFHPTFVAEYSNNTAPLQQIARELAEEIQNIFPSGPYNIIGMSWGGALALEIAKILQKRTKSVQVTFVDGAPDTIRQTILHLGEPVNIEVSILSNLLNITSTEILRSISNAPNTASRLDIALKLYKDDEGNYNDLRGAINLLLHKVMCLVSYKTSEELFSGDVFLIRPAGSSKYDDCDLSKFASKKIQIRVVSGDHLSMLQGKEVTDIINDNVMIR